MDIYDIIRSLREYLESKLGLNIKQIVLRDIVKTDKYEAYHVKIDIKNDFSRRLVLREIQKYLYRILVSNKKRVFVEAGIARVK